MKHVHFLLAFALGIIFGGIVNMGIIMVGSFVIPPPLGTDTSTLANLRLAMPVMEPIHFLMPFLAHSLGTFVGAWLAARIAPFHKKAVGLAVGASFLAAGTALVFLLPSPLWFNVIDLVVAYLPMALLGTFLAGHKD